MADVHDICTAMALREFNDGLAALERCAELLRSDDIEPSEEAMKIEMAVTRAIETLRGSGCKVPRKR